MTRWQGNVIIGLLIVIATVVAFGVLKPKPAPPPPDSSVQRFTRFAESMTRTVNSRPPGELPYIAEKPGSSVSQFTIADLDVRKSESLRYPVRGVFSLVGKLDGKTIVIECNFRFDGEKWNYASVESAGSDMAEYRAVKDWLKNIAEATQK